MKAFILLADAVRVHDDATCSMLRGGIDRIGVPKGQPALFRGSVLVRINGTRGEAGKHEFTLRCTDADGVPVLPEVSGVFEIPRAGGSTLFASDLQTVFPKCGTYQFSISADRHELDTYALEAVETDIPPAAEE